MANDFTLSLDIKLKNRMTPFQIRENDSVRFTINIKDAGEIMDLSGISTATLVNVRADQEVFPTPGTIIGNQIIFDLGTNEVARDGRVTATVQLYTGTERISTFAFVYVVMLDLINGYTPYPEEFSLVDVIFHEGAALLEQAAADGLFARQQAETLAAMIAAGIKAEKGDQGIQGIQGDQGIQGVQGIQGNKGDKGDTGLTGSQGIKGDSGDVASQAQLDSLTTSLAEKAKQTDLILKADKTLVDANYSTLNTKINSQASGSPKGSYATVTALQTAFPTGNANIYLVTTGATAGHWYYWNASAWTDGGVYQSAECRWIC
jgi:hypothetical protein